jgi:hypothetical protein
MTINIVKSVANIQLKMNLKYFTVMDSFMNM